MTHRVAHFAPSQARQGMDATAFRAAKALGLAFTLVLAMLFSASTANAAFTISDWKLTPSSTQAGGHPNVNFHLDPDAAQGDLNGDDLKSVTIDFSAGMLANAAAIQPPCTVTKFNSDLCASSTLMGTVTMQARKSGAYFSMSGSMYQLTPDPDSVMSFGIVIRPSGFQKIFLRSSKVTGVVGVRTGVDADYGLSATIPAIPRTVVTSRGVVSNITVSQVDVKLNAKTAGGKYLTLNPTRCTPAPSRATMVSYLGVTIQKTSSFTPTGCASVPFTPSATLTATNYNAGAAAGLTASFSIPTADATIQQSEIKDVTATLPAGTSFNSPAIAAVAALCTDAQLNTDTCPAASQIGTAGATVPFLPPAMTGKVFMTSRTAGSVGFGVVLRGAQNTIVAVKGQAALVDLDADGTPETARASLTTLPQVPVANATLNFTTPVLKNATSGCGSANASVALAGYSGASSTKTIAYPLVNCFVPPVVSITNPANGSTLATQSFNAAFSASSPTGTAISGYQCKFENLSTGATVSDVACVDGKTYSNLPNGQQYRLTVTATDANGSTGTATSSFSVNAPPPAAPTPFDGPLGVATTDRTPTFVLAYPQAASFPNAAFQCAITPQGTAPATWTICGAAQLGGGQYTSPASLTNGAYQFNARAVDGYVFSSTVVVPFGVADWASTFTKNLTVATPLPNQAGGHPDLDVSFKPAAGQLRSTNVLLPRGFLGSLTAFPPCEVVDADAGNCPAATQVGTSTAALKVLGNAATIPDGAVFLTKPRALGDIGGLSVKLPSPNPALAPVIVPLRIKVENNSQQMRMFNDALPITTKYLPTGSNVNMYVSDFSLHLNGSQSSPGYPTKLLTNSSNCVSPSFLTVTQGDTEGNVVTDNQPYIASGCATVPFAASVTQTTPNAVPEQTTTIKSVVSIPLEQSSVKTVTVYQPPALGPNFPAFGQGADKCPATAAPTASSLFDPTNCPPQAAVGTMTLISPLIPYPVTGKVYLIEKSPIPWLGADTAFAPLGISIRLVGTNLFEDPAPDCDPNVDMCQQRLRTKFDFAPDIPVTSITLDLSGPSRTAANGSTLAPEMLVTAAADDPACVTDSKIKSIVDPTSGTPGIVAYQPITIAGCSQ